MAKKGQRAGGVCKDGYRRISVLGKSYAAHRLAWLFMNGQLPNGQLDHIDGDRDNNSLANLRIATPSENQQNLRGSRIGKVVPAPLGVTFNKNVQKWQSQIKLNGKSKYLGLFDNPQEAHAAYLAAKSEIHPFSTIAQAKE
jgi:hypothetical protein